MDHCNYQLSNASHVQCRTLISIEERSYQDWLFLLDEHRALISDENNNKLMNSKSLAAKLLYIACNSTIAFMKEELKGSMLSKSGQACLLQKARGTWAGNEYVHIKNLFTVIREKNIYIEEFINIEIPLSFLNTLMHKKETVKEKTPCIAPWCKSYNKIGSMEHTSTSSKLLSGNRKLKYYLYCKECGVMYAIESLTGLLVERGYFIDLAWHKVRPLLLQGKTVADIAHQVQETKVSVLSLWKRTCVIVDWRM